MHYIEMVFRDFERLGVSPENVELYLWGIFFARSKTMIL